MKARSIVTVLFLLATLGCQRKPKVEVSSIIIQAPQSLSTKGVGTFAALPAGRKACYGINVSAPDIAPTYVSCSPSMGIVAGYAASGGKLEAAVPRGANRKIDLYLYLLATGDNSPCPVMTKDLSGARLVDTYHVGTANVNLQKDVETVNIAAVFPGAATNLASQLSMPSSCTSASTSNSTPGFGIASGAGTASTTNINLRAKIGTPVGATATGTGYELRLNAIR